MTTTKAGCGCHDATDSAGSTGSTGTPAKPGQPANSAAVCGFTSLNPEDGLFLRAQHLTTIQDYGRAFAMAIGQGAGGGVVYGFDLALDTAEAALTVAPGLALNELGRPLLSPSPITVGLPSHASGSVSTTYWVVKACSTSSLTGQENRYGSVCDDPCRGDGASIQPFRCEEVAIEIDAVTVDDLGRQEQSHRRNWLASYYFERERELSGPWLTRGTETALQQPRLSRPWGSGNPAPLADCVPIGVLLVVNGAFVLDTWIARRDIGAGYADDTWRWRLGMRPWNVFMAQVLQFQDQLTGFIDALAHPGVLEREVTDPKAAVVSRFLEVVQKRKGPTPDEVKEFQEEYAKASQPFTRLDATTPLTAKGFGELPPAGFLPLPPNRDELERQLEALFADRVDWRICSASADAVARAVNQAEHLDRIPLSNAKDRPKVDILVPDIKPDLTALQTEYGWVAFVRRRDVHCAETRDLEEVPVYVMELDDPGTLQHEEELRALFTGPKTTEATGQTATGASGTSARQPTVFGSPLIGTLLFPPGGWEYPGNKAALEMLAYDDRLMLGAVAITIEDNRRPLGALRAHLFLASLVQQRSFVPVQALATLAAPQELIVIFVGSPRLTRESGQLREEEAAALRDPAAARSATAAPRAASAASATRKKATKRTTSGRTAEKTP